MIKHIFLGLVLLPCIVMAQLVGQESQELILGADTIDLDGDDVTLLFGEPFSTDGVWTPDLDSAGVYVVDVVATDGEKSTRSQVEVVVENTNQPPEPFMGHLYIVEGASVHMDMFWSDPDNDVLYHTNSEPFTDFVWEVGYDEAGVHEFELETSDAEYTVEHTFIVTVEESNMRPNITGLFMESPVEIFENETVNLSIVVDEDSDYNVTWLLNNETFSVQQETRYTFDFDMAGTHNLTVQVFDGEYTVIHSWEVFVEDVDRAPELENVYAETMEGVVYTVSLPETDLDGDNITYIYPTPFTSNGTYTFDYNESGVYEYVILYSDGTHDGAVKLFLTVENVNLAPSINVDDIVVSEGTWLNWTFDVQDLDNDTVTLEVKGLPDHATVNESVVWYADYDAIERKPNKFSNVLNAIGLESLLLNGREYTVTFIACDQEYCVEEQRMLTVHNTNRAPIITELYNQTLRENEAFELYVGASDADNDVLDYTFGWPLDKNGAWTPSYDDAGEYIVPVTVKDRDSSVTEYVTLSVEHVNRAPQINGDERIIVNEGDTLEFTLDIYDADDDILFVEPAWLPQGATFNSTTFSWDIPTGIIYDNDPTLLSKFAELTAFGNKYLNPYKDVSSIDFIVSDGNLTDTVSVELRIADRNVAPEVVAVQDSFRSVGVYEPLAFTVDVSDLDNDEITYEWSFSGFDTQVIRDTNEITHQFIYPGQKQVTVVVSDGIDSESYAWDVDVLPERVTTTNDITYTVVELSNWK